jgi:VIT1/CCC1 family predicted Fe2+/Mn2+ transporter
VIRDIIIGLSDGLTVPFALTAGLSGLDNSKIVVIGGLAELVSGCISMGVGGMLSAQAELDHFRYTQRQTALRVKNSRSHTLHQSVLSIFKPLGLSAETASHITTELYLVEIEERRDHDMSQASLPTPSVASSSTRSKSKEETIFIPQRGLTPLLLSMDEGLQEIEEKRVWQSALTIGISYFLGGFIPLLPYLFIASVQTALFASIGITAIVLLIFGVVKQKCTGRGDARSLLKSALSTLAVGAVAAGSSWAIVRALET